MSPAFRLSGGRTRKFPVGREFGRRDNGGMRACDAKLAVKFYLVRRTIAGCPALQGNFGVTDRGDGRS